MTLGDYIVKAENRYRGSMSERKGQAYYNTLAEIGRHDLTDKVVGTHADPFYNDDALPFFLEVINREW